MYINTGNTGHDENLIQLAGRLFGIDKRTQEQGKIIWGPRPTLEKLYDGFKSMTYFVAKLKDDVTLLERKREVLRAVYNSVSGHVVSDTHQVTNKSMQNRCRKRIAAEVEQTEKAIKRAKHDKGVGVSGRYFDDKFDPMTLNAHVPIAEPVATPVGQTIAEPVASPDVPVMEDLSSTEEMDELWEENKASIVRAMRAIVVRNDGKVSLSTMAYHLPGEDDAPAYNVSVTKFLRRIVATKDVMFRAGLFFQDEKFWAVSQQLRLGPCC